MDNALEPGLLRRMDAYWRAANYLSVGQIYLLDNPLLKQPLELKHIKPRLLGHWGTTPGLTDLADEHPEDAEGLDRPERSGQSQNPCRRYANGAGRRPSLAAPMRRDKAERRRGGPACSARGRRAIRAPKAGIQAGSAE
jgi:hypothetical protein